MFEFRTLVVDNWRDGNVLLAGDAAHRMPPFQGQGMCSGIRDATALAWRLDLVLRGVADAAILDSYTQERRPHVRQLIMNSAERGRLFWLTDPEAARQRDRRLRQGYVTGNLKKGYGSVPILTDGVLMKDSSGVAAPAGCLSSQFRVRHVGEAGLLDDHVGGHWLLLSMEPRLTAALTSTERHLLTGLRARWVVLGSKEADDGFDDVDGDYQRWLNELGVKTLLIRPDCYIFGGAADTAGVHAMLTSLREQLHLKTEFA